MNCKILAFFVLCLVVVGFSQENWTGYRDTSAIHGFKADTTCRSKVFPLSVYEHTTVAVFFNDTTAAGFASDSAVFSYGYELGIPCLRTTGVVDTAWSPTVYVASLTAAAIGLTTSGTADSTLTTTRINAWADTTQVTGWAYTFTQIVPEGGAPLIRYVLTGGVGNCNTALRVMVQNSRRLGMSTRTR
jgi:hypothetical protein